MISNFGRLDPSEDSPAASASALRRIRLGLVLMNLFAALLCAAVLRWQWLGEMASARSQARDTAALLASGANATLDIASRALTGLSDQLEQALAQGPIDRQRLEPLLGGAAARAPEVQGFVVFDQAGQEVCAQPAAQCRAFSIADTGYFARYRAAPQAGPGFHGPFRDWADSSDAALLVRGLRFPDGRFAGVAVALLAPASLRQLVESAALGPNGVASLRTTGQFELLARHPTLSPSRGAAQTASMVSRLGSATAQAPDAGDFTGVSTMDGLKRVNAYRKLAGYPVYAVVGEATDDFLAGWRTTLGACLGFLLTFAAVSVLIDRIARKSHRRRLLAQALYDSAPCGYHSLDSAGRFLRLNATELGWLGCRSEELVGSRRLADFLSPESAAAFEAAYSHHMADAQALHGIELELVGRQGSARRVIVSAMPVLGPDGRLLSSHGVAHDITALHAARVQLEHRNAEQQRMLDTDIVGMLIVQDDRVVWRNPGMDRIFGYSADEWAGMPVSRLYPDPQDYYLLTRRNSAPPPGQGLARRQLELRRKDGSAVWIDGFRVQLAPNRTFSILSDISALKEAEEARVRATELQAANQVLADTVRIKDQFLANLSHELRTPLNAVIGFAQLLKLPQVADDADKRDRYLDSIADSGQQVLGLVENMLDFARAEAGRLRFTLESLDVRQLLEDSLQRVRPEQLRHQVTIDLEVDPTLQTVVNDPLRLRQMVLGLLSNAVKFSHPGGKVSLRAQGLGADSWCIEVADQGIGIRAEDQPRLFQSFVQLSEGLTKVYGGTGLGLALVRQLARAQGGDVQLRSAFGVGSVFTLTLPRQPTCPSH